MPQNHPAKASPASPTPVAERAQSLDVLRGVAVLGILAMNIRLFAMPQAAYFNPTAYGDFTGVNQWLYWLGNILADQKFMTLFSLMFGVGIALMNDRLMASGRAVIGLLYRRTFWLLLLGLGHAYLIWYGDILVAYALCGFAVILLRNWRARTQLVVGSLMLIVPSALMVLGGLSYEYWPPEAVEASLADWAPGAEALASEITVYRGHWMGQLPLRISTAVEFQTAIFLMFLFWRAGGLMLIGMACYRWGLFTAKASRTVYRRLVLLGLLVAMPLMAWGQYLNEQANWSYAESFFLYGQLNYWGSIGLALAYLALVMLWCQGLNWPGLRERFAAVGRMAFTNYLAQSLVCTFVFYGHGLGLFARLQHWQMGLVVLVIWFSQLLISPLWLKHFRFGPMEWLWRSLTYWKLQPFRR